VARVGRVAALRAAVADHPGLGRLVAVRFGAQWGDGVFQAALGGAVLFNPERQADPAAIVAGLAVLLLPYSVVGPFTGALLDRWDRRRVLLWANLVRAAAIVAVAVVVALGVSGPGLFVGALAVTGVSRFVLAGLSAALPHVVRTQAIVGVNAALSTSGAVVAVLGAATALGVRAAVGAGDLGSGVAVAVAAVGSVGAGLVAVGYPRQALGPGGGPAGGSGSTVGSGSTAGAVAAGLGRGARAAWEAPGVAAALLALGAHRVAFGINTLLALLLVRYAFTGSSPLLPSGIAGFGQVVAAGAVGLLLAAVLTPLLVRRWGQRRAVTGALAVAVVAQLVLVPTLAQGPVLLAALVLGTAGQVVKLSADAAMQTQVDDAHRGQVFALQDAVFNVAYVAAVAGAATVVPADGRSVGLAVAAGGVYALGLLGHLLVSHRRP
jgi:hypothetical protein